jgi:hypothetical protein
VTIQVEPFLRSAPHHQHSSSSSSSGAGGTTNSHQQEQAAASWTPDGLAACRAVLRHIRGGGARAGVALSLPTPVDLVAPLVEAGEVDLVSPGGMVPGGVCATLSPAER